MSDPFNISEQDAQRIADDVEEAIGQDCRPVHWPTWIALTDKIEEAIWNRREAFEKRFCQGEELLYPRLSSQSLEVVYMTYEGQHIVNSFPLAELISFLREAPSP